MITLSQLKKAYGGVTALDIPELTTTIVNEFIKKIIVHEADKSSGLRRQ